MPAVWSLRSRRLGIETQKVDCLGVCRCQVVISKCWSRSLLGVEVRGIKGSGVRPVLKRPRFVSVKRLLSKVTDFLHFWVAYPNRVNKARARFLWGLLMYGKPVAEQAQIEAEILAAVAWQRELPRWQREHGRYIPGADTYLQDRRWEDEPVRVQAAPALGVRSQTNRDALHAALAQGPGRKQLRGAR